MTIAAPFTMDPDALLEMVAHARVWAMAEIHRDFDRASLEIDVTAFSRGAGALLEQVPRGPGRWFVNSCAPPAGKVVYELLDGETTCGPCDLRVFADRKSAMAAVFSKGTGAPLETDNPQVLIFWENERPDRFNPGYALGAEPGRYRFDGMARVL